MCLTDLEFLAEHVLIPGEFGPAFKLCNWHRERLRELSDSVVNHVLRRLDLWFRNGFKSTFISRYSNIFRFLRNPNITILVRHGDAGKAEGLVMGCKNHLMYNPVFRELFPEYCPEAGERNFGTRSEFNVRNSENFSPEPTMRGIGIDSNLTGDHYMHIHDDDIENETNVTTADTRFKLIRKFQDTPSLLTSPLVYKATHSMCGTTWHAEGLYLGYIIPKFSLEADCSPDAKYIVKMYPACLPDLTPLVPEILDRNALKLKLEEEDVYRFSSNYLLKPTDPSTATFKEEWIRYKPYPAALELNDKWWLKDCAVRRVCTIDLAESISRDADLLAYLVVDIDDTGKWYYRECFEQRMDTYAFIRHIQERHRFWQFDVVYTDAVATQNYFSKWLLRENHLADLSMPLVPVKKISGQKSKDQRILACQARWARGDSFMVENAVGTRLFEHNLVNYPAVGHDDMLDAMAQLEMMEGRGDRKRAEEAPAGSFDHIRSLTKPRSRRQIGSWWDTPNSPRHINIPLVRARYGK